MGKREKDEQVLSKQMEHTKYIVLKKTNQGLPDGHWTYIALIDRRKSKEHWWTVDINEAMQFNLESAAKDKTKSLKYGPCRVIPVSKFDKFVGREFWIAKENTALTNEVIRKENEWHNDDWYEGINDD